MLASPLPRLSSKLHPKVSQSDMQLGKLSRTPELQEKVDEVSEDEEEIESEMMGGVSLRVYEKLKHKVFSIHPVERTG